MINNFTGIEEYLKVEIVFKTYNEQFDGKSKLFHVCITSFYFNNSPYEMGRIIIGPADILSQSDVLTTSLVRRSIGIQNVTSERRRSDVAIFCVAKTTKNRRCSDVAKMTNIQRRKLRSELRRFDVVTLTQITIF